MAGRLVNVYNPADWYLEVYHRGNNLGAVAGTRAIEDAKGVARVENVCLERDVINSHANYAKKCGQILMDVGIGDVEKPREWASVVSLEKNSDDESSGDAEDAENIGGEIGDEVMLFNEKTRRRQSGRRNSCGD